MKSILYISVILLVSFGCSIKDNTVDLNSTVHFTGTQFVIQNKDTFDYNDAKLEINDKYVLEHINIPAGQIFTVGFLNFADSEGNRFTFVMKPLSFSIWCDLQNDNNGFYYATFE